VTITEAIASSTEPATLVAPQKTQPLWRFALVGLGALAALAIFGLLSAFIQGPF